MLAASGGDALRSVADLLNAGERGAEATALTPRERDVRAQLARGMSNKGINRTLGIGLATVKNHVHEVLARLSLALSPVSAESRSD